ncbi:MAG: hypothetical protein MR553_08280, partial [Veillonellaceae bacterium]|nr:hypothetical protein [Veillonellaceae bacterium]
MIESATGPLLLCKSRSLPTQKCQAPPAVAELSRLIDTINPNNSAIFVENMSFQTVPKQKGAMNTLISDMGGKLMQEISLKWRQHSVRGIFFL